MRSAVVSLILVVTMLSGCVTPTTTDPTGVSPMISVMQKISEKDMEIRTAWKARSDGNFEAWVDAQTALDLMDWELECEDVAGEDGQVTVEEAKTLMAYRNDQIAKIDVKRDGYKADIAAVNERAEMNDARKAALLAAVQNSGQDMAKGAGLGAAFGALLTLLLTGGI